MLHINVNNSTSQAMDIPPIRFVNIVNIVLDAFIFICTSTFIYTFQCRHTFLFKKPSNKLMFSLTIADCFTSLVAISHVLQEIIPAFYANDCRMCIPAAIMVDVLTTFLSMVSILHLCMFTFDRYTSIYRALLYNVVMSNKFVNKILFVVWLAPFVASVIQVVYLQPYIAGDVITQTKAEEIFNFEMIYSIASFVLFTLLPGVLISIAYAAMFIEIRKLLNKTPILAVDSDVFSKQLKMAFAFCMMYVCFMLFSVPYFTLRLMVDVMTWVQMPVNIPILIFDLTYIFKNFSLLCNSFIYLIMNKEFRYSLLKVIRGSHANKQDIYALKSLSQFDSKTYSSCSNISKSTRMTISRSCTDNVTDV